MRHLFFVGIGGMGMSGLAKVMAGRGHQVAGSDRNLDGEYCRRLAALGVQLLPQDGTGPETWLRERQIAPGQLEIVKSTAVEDQVPDIVTARRLGLRELMRSDLLAEIFNDGVGLAIAGTAGKTTTSGLVTWILHHTGRDPTAVVGGIIGGLDTNALAGGDTVVIEADESDGSLVKYRPHVALINNIFFDHLPLEQLRELFLTYARNTVAVGRDGRPGTVVVNGDDENIAAIRDRIDRPVTTVGLGADCEIRPEAVIHGEQGLGFVVQGQRFESHLVGEHNLRNLLAGIAMARLAGVSLPAIATAVAAFPGMRRRFERVGVARGVTVIDDFAHCPDEIAATVKTARTRSKRRFLVYQPHGYGPTRLTRNRLVEVFASLDAHAEHLYLDDIYYGGGTVQKDVSSADLAAEVRQRFANAHYLGARDKIIADIAAKAEPGDMVVVMGARDINAICQPLLDAL